MTGFVFEKRSNALLALLVMIAISGIFTISSLYKPVFGFRIEIIRTVLLIILMLFNLLLLVNAIKIRIWGLREYFLLFSFLLVNIFLILMIINKACLVFRLIVFLFLMFSLLLSTKSTKIVLKKVEKRGEEKTEKRETIAEEAKEKNELKEKLVEELKKEAEILEKSEKIIESLSKKFVGSSKNKVFHKKDCKIAKRILRKNRIYFENKSDALSSGYKPCSICNP